MQGYAVVKPAVMKSKINKRLIIPKLLFVPAIAFALVSKDIYIENGFWDTTWEVVAFLFLLIAAFGRVWCAAYISGRKNVELVTDGPYSLSRNPLYFCSFLGFIGAGLAFEKLTAALLFVVVFFFTHWPTILAEESKLRKKFGETYEDYAKSVSRFWPRLGPMNVPDSITISPKIFNRAVLHCSYIMLVYILAHLIEYGQGAGVIPVLLRDVP
jgi:protein-S-isoprenylcysteine O-methyltransferase Ste14